MKKTCYIVLIIAFLAVIVSTLGTIDFSIVSEPLERNTPQNDPSPETIATPPQEATDALLSEPDLGTPPKSEPEYTHEPSLKVANRAPRSEPGVDGSESNKFPAESPPDEGSEPRPETEAANEPAPEHESTEPEPTHKPSADPNPETPPAPAPPDQFVAELHAKYESALVDQAERTYESGFASLKANYIAALKREEGAAEAEADLDTMLAWRNERNRVRGENPDGITVANPPRLAEMRRIYEEQKERLKQERDTRRRDLTATYDSALRDREKALMQAHQVEDALAVREWRTPFIAVDGNDHTGRETAQVGTVSMPKRLTGADIDKGEVGTEYELTLPGGIPMIFRWCPPGKFIMGSPPDEEGREPMRGDGFQPDETQHLVELTNGFWLAKFEVTQGQWRAVMGTTVEEQHALIPNRDTQPWLSLSGEGPDEPMYFVNSEEAAAFCERLGRRIRLPGGWDFALPTEAQWEYACRAGTTGPFGSDDSLEEIGWHIENSGGATNPVGGKRANAWGLYDMHGNVWEWCRDWYGTYPDGVVIDPIGPETGAERIFRGGSWDNPAVSSRSASRSKGGPTLRYNRLGFRPVISS